MTDKSSIRIESLKNIPFDEISDAFMAAFADYGMPLDKSSLNDMFIRRGARFDLSFAAFDGDRIVSFIINGTGCFNGRVTAYDTGTGTLKEYRGIRLTDMIFNHSVPLLKEAGVEAYLLEVLTHNAPAVKIYKRQGFGITREFNCYCSENRLIQKRLQKVGNQCIDIREVEAEDVGIASRFMDFNPSWQNSLDSICRNRQAFKCLMSYVDDKPVGIGVSEIAYGDISLLAVDRAYRRQGIGSALLHRLIEFNLCNRAKVINVEDSCDDMKSFLVNAGFELTCRQYEMAKML